MIVDKIIELFMIFLVKNWSIAGCFGHSISYAENSKLIQQRTGLDIKLECSLDGIVDLNKDNETKIHWFFKPCRETSSNNLKRHDFNEDDWLQLPCEANNCKSNLMLRNLTEKYSGLYKCTISYPNRLEAGIQLVRTYQLDVKNATVDIPEFLDTSPLNKTAVLGTQAVFQCRVYSAVHPTIKWFHRIPEPYSSNLDNAGNENFNNARFVKYNGNVYELLPTAREKFINNEIYLSKMILNEVKTEDEGYYACVAISYRGHKIREAFLKVDTNAVNAENLTATNNMEDDVTHLKEFLLLFLMPILLLFLAVLPITVWLCFIIFKRCGGKDMPNKNVKVQQYLNYKEENLTSQRVALAS